LRHWTDTGFPSVHQCPILLWSHPEVFDPFVKPGGFECARGHLGDRCRGVGSTQSTKTLLGHRTDVWVAGIRCCAQPREDEECDEVGLIKHVHMRVRGKISTIT